MKPAHLFLFMAVILLGSAMASALRAQDMNLEPIQIGNLEIYPILDASTSMEKTLVPDLDKYPQYQQLFEKGPVPAVCQTWYLQSGTRRILIDTGWGNELRVKGETINTLKANGISPGSISDILLTHLDMDHIGGLVENGRAAFPNATLWISAPEAASWKEGNIKNRPEAALARARALWDVYPGRIKLFDYGQEILPGIYALDASGHTPGHTAFEIVSGNDKMIIGGDLLHIYQIQLQKPEISTIYDMDPQKAAQARKEVLDRSVSENAMFGGMHLPLISTVRKSDSGGFLMMEPR